MLSGEDFGYLKDEDQNRLGIIVKKSLLIGSVLFSIACFIYITINAYYFAYHDKGSNIKVIQSPPEPIKIIEENSAENAVKDIDKTIYDSIVGNKNLNRENLNQVRIIEKANTPIASSDARRAIAAQESSETDLSTNRPINDKQAVAPKINNSSMMVYDGATGSAKTNINSNTTKKEQPSAQVFEAKKDTTKKERGLSRVQVAALTSKSAATDYWMKLKKSYPNILSNLNYFISEVNLGSKGTFYRLQIGNFRSQVDAEEFCRKFLVQTAKSKSDCIIVE